MLSLQEVHEHGTELENWLRKNDFLDKPYKR